MGRIAFVLLPFSWQDYAAYFPGGLKWPRFVWEKTRRFLPVLRVGEFGWQSPFANVQGDFIYCPLPKKEFAHFSSELISLKRQKAIKLAEKTARFWGISPYLAIGEPHETVGYNYQLFVLGQNVREAVELLAPRKISIVIWGAAAPLGKIAARLLAQKNKTIILADLELGELEKLAAQILYESGLVVKITTRINQVLAEASIIVLASELPPNFYLPAASLIFNLILPGNSWVKAKGLLTVLEEMWVELPPGVSWEPFFPPGHCPAFWAGTLLSALQKEVVEGKVTLPQVEKMGELGQRHGFRPQSLRKIIVKRRCFF